MTAQQMSLTEYYGGAVPMTEWIDEFNGQTPQRSLFNIEERTDLKKDGQVVTDPNGHSFQYNVFPEMKTL